MRSIYRWWIKMLWIGLIITKRGFFFLSYPFSYLSSLSVWVHKSFFYIIIFSFLFRFVSVTAAACGFCCATFERVEMRKQVFLQFYYLKLWVFWHSKYRKKSKNRKNGNKKKNWRHFISLSVLMLRNLIETIWILFVMVEKSKLKLCGNVELT